MSNQSSNLPADSRRTREHVVLIHGLWMPARGMKKLARLLESRGYTTSIFSYRSVRDRFADHVPACAAHLQQVMETQNPKRLNIVGHSMGGLVALKTIRYCKQQGIALPPGRQVLLGSPLNGSLIAQQRTRSGAVLIGRSQATLAQPQIQLPGDRPTGVIAGSVSRGTGRWLSKLPSPNDGTVSVAETKLPLLTDHIVLGVSHSGMLLQAGVVTQIVHFLRHGYFQHCP